MPNLQFKSLCGLMHVRPIFSFIFEKLAAGQRCALVTVIAVSGASTRDPGTHMAVSDDGAFSGSLSGGCIEAAVVAESLAAIAANAPREVSYGAGSRFIDLRLPCGGRIDLLISPLSDLEMMTLLMAAVDARTPFTLVLPRLSGQPRIVDQMAHERLVSGEDVFEVGHVPDLRLLVMGHGASVTALVKLAGALSVDTIMVSPDALNIAQATELGAVAHQLKMPSDTAPNLDAWTAAVFLFHEHEWETVQLAQALASPAFYVGAMGSYKTHAARLAALAEIGVPEIDRMRIVAPIGLIPSSRDPETLALSTLTQVVAAYHAHVAKAFGRASGR